MHRGARVRGGLFGEERARRERAVPGAAGGGGRFKIDARATASRTAGPSLRAENPAPRLRGGGGGVRGRGGLGKSVFLGSCRAGARLWF